MSVERFGCTPERYATWLEVRAKAIAQAEAAAFERGRASYRAEVEAAIAATRLRWANGGSGRCAHNALDQLAAALPPATPTATEEP